MRKRTETSWLISTDAVEKTGHMHHECIVLGLHGNGACVLVRWYIGIMSDRNARGIGVAQTLPCTRWMVVRTYQGNLA